MVSLTCCSSLVVLLVAIVALPLYHVGYFKTFSGTLGDKCSIVTVPGKTLIGVEDIDDNPNEKILILSSDDRYWAVNAFSSKNKDSIFTGKNGDIYSLYYGEGTDLVPKKMQLKNYKDIDFHPHGIGLVPAVGDLLPRLFIVNHKRTGEYVEIFDVDYQTNTLFHVTSINHPSFKNINDVTPVDHFSFFVSNIFSQPMSQLSIFIALGIAPGGSVVYCHGEGDKYDCKFVLENLFSSNGVFLQDMSLFVVVTNEVQHYHFHKHNTSLSLIDTYPTPNTQCDNLAQDKDGALYTACHPSSYLAYKHILDSKSHAPTQIMKKGKNEKIFHNLFESAGEDYSAATVATPDNMGYIYMGSVWEDGVMRCEMK